MVSGRLGQATSFVAARVGGELNELDQSGTRSWHQTSPVIVHDSDAISTFEPSFPLLNHSIAVRSPKIEIIHLPHPYPEN